jgi:hypothetical protein
MQWEVTVTDNHGKAVGAVHCRRSERARSTRQRADILQTTGATRHLRHGCKRQERLRPGWSLIDDSARVPDQVKSPTGADRRGRSNQGIRTQTMPAYRGSLRVKWNRSDGRTTA